MKFFIPLLLFATLVCVVIATVTDTHVDSSPVVATEAEAPSKSADYNGLNDPLYASIRVADDEELVKIEQVSADKDLGGEPGEEEVVHTEQVGPEEEVAGSETELPSSEKTVTTDADPLAHPAPADLDASSDEASLDSTAARYGYKHKTCKTKCQIKRGGCPRYCRTVGCSKKVHKYRVRVTYHKRVRYAVNVRRRVRVHALKVVCKRKKYYKYGRKYCGRKHKRGCWVYKKKCKKVRRTYYKWVTGKVYKYKTKKVHKYVWKYKTKRGFRCLYKKKGGHH